MKALVSLFSVVVAVSAFAVTPKVSDVSIAQDAGRNVIVSYTLAGAPAIVTVDFFTNGVSVSKLVSTVSGDGNCLVAENGRHAMTWKVRKDWPDRTTKLKESVRAEVKAFHPSNPPDMIVLNLKEGSVPGANYYASCESLPGGLDSDIYRTTRLALRKCPVKYRTYQVGVPFYVYGRNSGEDTDVYAVTFTNDYYLGVFETTQAQWRELMGYYHRAWRFFSTDNDNWKVRPVINAAHTELRESGSESDSINVDSTYWYPHTPSPDSFFGKLYARTGLRCDLPSRSQWSVAALAGQYYGIDGQPITNATHTAAADEVGRNKYNGGNYYIDGRYVVPGDESTLGAGAPLTVGSARVGSYRPNPWGFYDMSGNAEEITLDQYQGRGMANLHDVSGEPYVTPGYDRTVPSVGYITLGGSWNGGAASGILTAGRGALINNNQHTGFRVFYRVNQAAFYSDL